jgi:hypothetical protein
MAMTRFGGDLEKNDLPLDFDRKKAVRPARLALLPFVGNDVVSPLGRFPAMPFSGKRPLSCASGTGDRRSSNASAPSTVRFDPGRVRVIDLSFRTRQRRPTSA